MMEIVKVELSGDELYDVLLREKQMEQRRRDQKEHSHKHIWTKEPHGGRYKDTFSHGYDALKERPDGKYLKVLPGYERPQCGPTTNFVGNHMTQGAIDLVQMELQPAADPDVRLLELHPRVDTRLLALDSAEAASETGPGPQALPVQEYTWQDKGSHIHVRVTSTGHVAGSTSLEVSNTGFCLRYTKQNDTVKPETCHRALNINPLYAEVIPEVSEIIEVGGDIMEPKATSADASAIAFVRQQQRTLHISLVKADKTITWEALASELQPIRSDVDAKTSNSRLALIRRALRAQRKQQHSQQGNSGRGSYAGNLLQICC